MICSVKSKHSSSLSDKTPLKMTSTLPLPIALAHSVNSSGRFGLFVDPYSCSCGTCTEYCAEPLSVEPERAPTPPPAPAPLLAASSGVSLERAPANHLWTGSDWVHQDSPYARSPATSVFLSPTALLARPLTFGLGGLSRGLSRAATGLFEPAPISPLGRSSSVSVPPASVRPTEDDVMDLLRSLRADLQIRQREVYSGATASHDEQAAQDAEWSELDRKINAIEQTLLTFGAIFRTG